jgi:hypothetical protein
MAGIFSKITVRALGAQTRDVDYVETGLTSRTDVTFVSTAT